MCYSEDVTVPTGVEGRCKNGELSELYNCRHGWCGMSLHQQMVGWR